MRGCTSTHVSPMTNVEARTSRSRPSPQQMQATRIFVFFCFTVLVERDVSAQLMINDRTQANWTQLLTSICRDVAFHNLTHTTCGTDSYIAIELTPGSNRIDNLSLRGPGVCGSLPSYVSFAHLRTLTVDRTELTGSLTTLTTWVMPNLHHLILSDNERLSGPVPSFTVTFPVLQSLSIQDVPLHLSVEWTAPSVPPGFDNVSQVLLLPKQSHLPESGDALTHTPHTSPDRSSLRRGLHTDSWGAITNRGMTRRLTSTPNQKRILFYIFFTNEQHFFFVI